MKFWYQIIYFAGLRARQLTKSTERLLNLNRWRCWLLLIHKNQNKTLSWREREGSLIKVWWVDTVGNVVVLINRPQTTNMTKSNSKPAGLDHSKYLVPCWLVQFNQSFPTLCDPMNHSTPGLPVHHQLLEFPQTHVHRVSDAIQPSHPLSSPSPPAPNPSQHQSLFQWVNFSHEVAKVLEFQL